MERFGASIYSRELRAALRDSQLFSNVRDLEMFKTPPDLIARVERPIWGTATIPVATALSLGLVPTTVQEEHGISFSLSSGSLRSGDRVPVEFSYSGPSTLGWYCLALNLSPNRTGRDVRTHRRYREGFAWALAQKRPEILRLLKESAD